MTPAAPPPPVLRADDVTVVREGRAIREEVDLTVRPDEPATGLDLAGRERLLDSLDPLREAHPELATVLVTHHLEELPAGTTHALLLRDGRALASGAVADVLTSDQVGKCFDHPVRLERRDGRWNVRARR